jgi:sterol desaturase/sphingolipid hydroxylase (fatty acid hydroxylase superfamily)
LHASNIVPNRLVRKHKVRYTHVLNYGQTNMTNSIDKPDSERRIIESPKTIVGVAVNETAELLKASGELQSGRGLISGVFAIALAFLCAIGVLAFHFPEYLTTPELRHMYSVDLLRHILFAALVLSGCISATNLLLRRSKGINFVAFVLVVTSVAFGGSHVPVANFPDHTPYIGLDWFILDLLGSTTIFVLIEKLFPLYKGQPIFRREWQTDMVHFSFNHFIVGLVLLTVNFLIHRIFGWMVYDGFQGYIQRIAFLPQVFLCVLVADFVQYWTHRAYHEVPYLWRYHGVHHSVKTMDWLAGSRQHVLELICTRVGVLGALYVFGFEKSVMDMYILIVGFQAVFNHANVHLPWGPLKYVFVTPDFHHWHHSSDEIAIDKNYAAHYAFLDHLFGTAIKGQKGFPENYGVVGDYMPSGFVKQQLYPFKRKRG